MRIPAGASMACSLGNLMSTCLLLASFFCVQSAPARPLNERSTEFAWVILDGDGSQTSPRRKITPKSIFISPSFGTQSCNSGYTLDANGRCVKVVKIDTSAHEQFVLELLNQNFYEDYDDDEENATGPGGAEALPTPGPFQLNIPLSMGVPKDNVSIIVAPTNGQFEDTLRIEDAKVSQLDAPIIVTTINEGKPPVECDTERDTTNMETTMPTIIVTNPNEMDEGLPTTTKTVETTTPAPVQEQQAIFFKIPTTSPTSEGSVESNAVTTQNPVADRTQDAEAAQANHTSSTTTTTHRNPVRFPDRQPYDDGLLQEFLQDMRKQVNRRFVTKAQAAEQLNSAGSEDALYNNHRNRDRWLFPRFLDEPDDQPPRRYRHSWEVATRSDHRAHR